MAKTTTNRNRKQPSVPPPMAQVTAEERSRRIAERAYFLAASRGFAPGAELEDWLAAEREIDREITAKA